MKKFKRSGGVAAILLAGIATVGVVSAQPASAVSAANTVDVTSSASGGTATATCAFLVSLPQTGSINDIPIVFTGTARAVGVAVSTSIQCYLTAGGTGGAGITLPGPVAAIAGNGSYKRLAPDPQICATVSAAFYDGSTAPSRTTCKDL